MVVRNSNEALVAPTVGPGGVCFWQVSRIRQPDSLLVRLVGI
jgi:hypothetical protein